jgi:CheY-like chemotaxis protein
MRTVLVIDDDADLRETVCGLLADDGYSVSSASDVPSALGKLTSSAVDLVFMDYAIPSPADGQAFLRTKAGDPRIASIPVVLMTGYRVDSEMDGTVAVLRKPFDAEALLAAIRRVIGPGDSTRGS